MISSSASSRPPDTSAPSSRASTTGSSRPRKRSLILFSRKTPQVKLYITPAPDFVNRETTPKTPPAVPGFWDAQSTTRLLPAPYGWTSTLVKASLMWMPVLRLKRWHVSHDPQVFQRRSTLDRAWVCMSIGRWTRTWSVRHGSGMRLDSNRYVSGTALKLGPSELRIFLQFYAPPEPTGESTAAPGWCNAGR